MSSTQQPPRRISSFGKGSFNPFVEDEKLQSLLKSVGSINAPEDFGRWKGSFLNKLESFLDQGGIETARQADAIALAKLERFNKTINAVRACVHHGAISADKKMGVKATTAVNRLKEGCVSNEKRLLDLVPGSSAEIKAVGYNKFQLGAVLVKDGFAVYGHMMFQQAALEELKPILELTVDHQIVDAINYYQRQITSLCDVMADLGLFTVMVKMREMAGDKCFAGRTKTMQLNKTQYEAEKKEDDHLGGSSDHKRNPLGGSNHSKGSLTSSSNHSISDIPKRPSSIKIIDTPAQEETQPPGRELSAPKAEEESTSKPKKPIGRSTSLTSPIAADTTATKPKKTTIRRSSSFNPTSSKPTSVSPKPKAAIRLPFRNPLRRSSSMAQVPGNVPTMFQPSAFSPKKRSASMKPLKAKALPEDIASSEPVTKPSMPAPLPRRSSSMKPIKVSVDSADVPGPKRSSSMKPIKVAADEDKPAPTKAKPSFPAPVPRRSSSMRPIKVDEPAPSRARPSFPAPAPRRSSSLKPKRPASFKPIQVEVASPIEEAPVVKPSPSPRRRSSSLSRTTPKVAETPSTTAADSLVLPPHPRTSRSSSVPRRTSSNSNAEEKPPTPPKSTMRAPSPRRRPTPTEFNSSYSNGPRAPSQGRRSSPVVTEFNSSYARESSLEPVKRNSSTGRPKRSSSTGPPKRSSSNGPPKRTSSKGPKRSSSKTRKAEKLRRISAKVAESEKAHNEPQEEDTLMPQAVAHQPREIPQSISIPTPDDNGTAKPNQRPPATDNEASGSPRGASLGIAKEPEKDVRTQSPTSRRPQPDKEQDMQPQSPQHGQGKPQPKEDMQSRSPQPITSKPQAEPRSVPKQPAQTPTKRPQPDQEQDIQPQSPQHGQARPQPDEDTQPQPDPAKPQSPTKEIVQHQPTQSKPQTQPDVQKQPPTKKPQQEQPQANQGKGQPENDVQPQHDAQGKEEDKRDDNKETPPQVDSPSPETDDDDVQDDDCDDDSDDDKYIVFFDPKTQTMGRLDRQKLIELGAITIGHDENDGSEFIHEGAPPKQEKSLLKKIKLGILKKMGLKGKGKKGGGPKAIATNNPAVQDRNEARMIVSGRSA